MSDPNVDMENTTVCTHHELELGTHPETPLPPKLIAREEDLEKICDLVYTLI